MNDVPGTGQGDADARLIVTLAAWTWTLEFVSQLDFVIAHSIRGAANYRRALQNHSINGKALAQADSQTTKARQEYVLAEMEVITCEKDIHELKDLIGRYSGEAALYAAAQAILYDSFLSMQISVGIQRHNMAWAYKYLALEDSPPPCLDPQKTAAQFRYNVYAINEAMDEVNSRDDRIPQCKSLYPANNVYP